MVKKKAKVTSKKSTVAKKTSYPVPDVDAMLQDLEDSKLGGDDRFWQFPDGKSRVRLIIDSETGKFYRPLVEIYVPSAEKSGKTQYFVSPKTEDPEAYDPADEAQRALWRAGKKDLAQRLRPVNRYLCNAMVFNPKTKEYEHKAVKMPFTVYKWCVQQLATQKDEGDDPHDNFLDDKNGTSIVVEKVKGKGDKIEYNTTMGTKRVPVLKEWREQSEDFDAACKPSDIDAIEKALCDYLDIDDLEELIGARSDNEEESEDEEGEEDDDESEDEEDDEEEDESDDADDEEEDDDEEYDVPPKAKKRVAKKCRR